MNESVERASARVFFLLGLEKKKGREEREREGIELTAILTLLSAFPVLTSYKHIVLSVPVLASTLVSL